MPIPNFSEDTFSSKKYIVQLTNDLLTVFALSKVYLFGAGEIIVLLKTGYITLIFPVSTNYFFILCIFFL